MHCFRTRTCIYIDTFILQYPKIHYQLFLYLPAALKTFKNNSLFSVLFIYLLVTAHAAYTSTLRLMRGCILTVKLSVCSPIPLPYYPISYNFSAEFPLSCYIEQQKFFTMQRNCPFSHSFHRHPS